MPLSTIFHYIVALSFTGGGNQSPQRKPPTDKLYHIMLYRVYLAMSRFELTLMVMDTDWIGSCKSNYHMITIMTVPSSNTWILLVMIVKKLIMLNKLFNISSIHRMVKHRVL